MNDLIEGLNEVQAEAVVHNEGPLLILSGAGSAEKAEQIQQAAFIFARVTRGAEEIADALRVSSRTVQRMIHLPAFQEELDRLGYQGERRFGKAHRAQGTERAPRGAERTQKPEYQKVKQLWQQMTDIPERGRARIIADRSDIKSSYNTVRRWCRDWRQK